MSEEYYATASIDRYDLLKDYSRENRKKATDAEKELWHHIRAGKLGVKFRRQHPILDFIVDFVCLSKMLVIEVDGGYHTTEAQEHDDKSRDERLANMGYKTLRFTNEQVLYQLDSVISDITKAINER